VVRQIVARIDVVRLKARLAESSLFTQNTSTARSEIMALSTGTNYTSPQAQEPQPTQSVICAALPKTGPAHNQHTLVLVLCWLLNWGGVNMAVVHIVGHVGWGREGFKGPLTVEYL